MLGPRTFALVLLAPALLLVALFFFSPVLLTAVFSFTDMTTATGVAAGGAYQIDPGALQRLRDNHHLPALADRLAEPSFVVTADTLAAMAGAGADAATVAELGAGHLGESFASRREAERMLKGLAHRPRSVREIKALSEAMNRSLAGTRYRARAALFAAFDELGIAAGDTERAAVADAAYTGWTWTADNFRRMLTTPDIRTIFRNTLFYVFVTMALFNTGFALLLAIATFYMPERPAALFRSLWLMPRVTPPVIYVLMWKWLAWDSGFLSRMLAPFAIAPRNWMLDTPANAWTFVVLINGFVGASMGMIIFSSAIRAIPRTLLYASEVDGANRLQQIRHIILPQIKWPILFITTYQSLSLMTSYDMILLSTNGGPGSSTEVWSLAVYHTALNTYSGNLQYGYGSAMALVLVALGIVLSLGYLRLFDFARLVGRPRIEN